MPLHPGTRVGVYDVVSVLGAGGMGEVYRARDTRLNRDVALKILPDRFAHDADALARFEREAQAVAALSHPNILAIHDFGRSGAITYSVTELLEGTTLRERLADGTLPVSKAIELSLQILRGLAAAHARGIVHRDLKPENVFLTRDGQVKLLDFGLAKSFEGAGSAAGVTEIAADATRLADTTPGTVLGTVGYMSPEQVRGQPVDQRTDIFSFGAVLYEMVTGTRAFQRETAPETMAAVLRDEVPDAPAGRAPGAGLDRIIRHCLEKDAGDRFQSARDVAFALEAFSGSTASESSSRVEARPSGTSTTRFTRERAGWLLVTLALAALTAWLAFGPSPSTSDPVVRRASILLPSGMEFRSNVPAGRRLAISPDGTRLAYVAAARGQAPVVFVYAFATGLSTVVPQSDRAAGVSWMADSRTLLFRQGQSLMAVDLPAGASVRRADAVGHAVAAADGGILASQDVATDNAVRYLAPGVNEWRDVGGRPASGNTTYPTWLPDGRFMVGVGTPSNVHWYAGDLTGAEWRQGPELKLDQDLVNPAVVSGYMITAQNQMLVARAFDAGTLAAASGSTILGGPIERQPQGSGAYSVSTHVLAYQASGAEPVTSLVWYDRRGARLSQLAENAAYSNLQLSPDRSRLLVGMVDPAVRTADIWAIDLNRGVRTRITTDPADERSGAWTPDGRGVVYRGINRDLFRRPIGQGAAEPFETDGASKDPFGFSPDGRYFIYRRSGAAGTSNDIWIKTVDPPTPGRPLLNSPFGETDGAISPDSRWLAYTSNESNRGEVYVTTFPDAREKWPVSVEGGSSPVWNPAGGEIFYLSADRVLMRVAVRSAGGTLQFEPPQALFETQASRGPGTQFIVSPDGQRFLVNTEVPSFETASIAVVFNWQALLRK